MSKVLDNTKSIMELALMSNPFLYISYKGMEKISEAIGNNKPDDEIQKMLAKGNVEMELAHRGAKIAQEQAIAKKIEFAEEVEIEEYYDVSGKGATGLEAKPDSINIGLSAEGRKITKRIYRFKTKGGEVQEVISQQ